MPLLEGDLQEAIFKWAETLIPKYPELEWFHSVPNGGKRNSFEAQNLKKQGVTPGILDLHLPVARGGFHGMMIELKKPGSKCEKARKEQEAYIEFLTAQGYATMLSNSFDEVKSCVMGYLEGRLIRGSNA